MEYQYLFIKAISASRICHEAFFCRVYENGIFFNELSCKICSAFLLLLASSIY